MASAVLILGVAPGSTQAGDLVAALRERGHDAILIPVDPGARGLARATVRARRALRRRPAAALITLSPPAGAHLAGRLLGRRRPRWLAHVGEPFALCRDRWGRILDPRARAVRRADAVTASAAAAGHLHGQAGASPRIAEGAGAIAPAGARARRRRSRPRPRRSVATRRPGRAGARRRPRRPSDRKSVV